MLKNTSYQRGVRNQIDRLDGSRADGDRAPDRSLSVVQRTVIAGSRAEEEDPKRPSGVIPGGDSCSILPMHRFEAKGQAHG